MIQRYPNWSSILDHTLNDRRLIPFAWGSNDCATGADIIIEAITGVSIMKPYRGTYSTALQAERIFRSKGSLVELADIECGKHGVLPINKRLAQRGCLCAVSFYDFKRRVQTSLAIVVPNGAMSPGPKGLVFHHYDTITSAWKI